MSESTETTSIPDEVTDVDGRFHALVRRLSEQSVRKNFDAYLDVPWDDHEIHSADPRWELDGDDPLARTAWYQALPQPERARLGLFAVVSKMKTGLEFENVLCRGILEYVNTLPNGAPEYRYAMHELIEEGQHQLMFQEFVNRSGIDVDGMPWDARLGSRIVVSMGSWFPELFFMFVLGGEDPIDHVQRESLRRGGAHPLLERIMKNHVTEEARHLSFARHYLKNRIESMPRRGRFALSIGTPLILGEMGRLMLMPSKQLVAEFAIPDHVIREAYTENPEFLEGAATALQKVRRLAGELGLLTPLARRIWKRKNIWADPED
ncbi:AurF N-oxygenase family protein [Actinospongicola halichondriae]|uniref:AurF N-oxygenase family protein n=1 Tax=Actinospongicola halichondriae TaxID=3236844 RepID=UPI003D5097B3